MAQRGSDIMETISRLLDAEASLRASRLARNSGAWGDTKPALQRDLPPSAKLLYVAMKQEDEHSAPALARCCGLTERTAYRAMRLLRGAGLVQAG